MRRVNALIAAHDELHGRVGRPRLVVSDVMRAAVVMTVAAFDALLHGILRVYLRSAASGVPKPPALLGLIKQWKLPAHDILAWTTAADGLLLLQAKADAHFVDRALQNPAKVAEVFKVLGVADIWADIATRMNTDKKTLKEEFTVVVKRRHSIVHEAETASLSVPRAKAFKELVAKIANEIESVMKARYPNVVPLAVPRRPRQARPRSAPSRQGELAL
jgi:hypothetical protein